MHREATDLPTFLYYSQQFLRHDTGHGHPECPERLTAIVELLKANVALCQQLKFPDFLPASSEDILRVHTSEYVALVQKTVTPSLSVSVIYKKKSKNFDTFFDK